MSLPTYEIGSYLLPNIYNVIKWKSSWNHTANYQIGVGTVAAAAAAAVMKTMSTTCINVRNGMYKWTTVFSNLIFQLWNIVCLYLLIWLKIAYVSRYFWWDYFTGTRNDLEHPVDTQTNTHMSNKYDARGKDYYYFIVKYNR